MDLPTLGSLDLDQIARSMDDYRASEASVPRQAIAYQGEADFAEPTHSKSMAPQAQPMAP